MSRKKQEESSNLGYLITPARDLVENFTIDIRKALNGYVDAIQKAAEEDENLEAGTYKVFDFPEACRVLSGSIAVYGKKVDHIYDLTMSVIDLVENSGNDNATGNAAPRKGAGRKKAQNVGSTSYELEDMKAIKAEAIKQLEKVEKEDKKAIDNLRLVDNAEINEAQYERKCLLVLKPTQFMFKLNYGQLSRTDEQIQNAKPRPDVIGKVKDFDIKKSDVNHEHQMLYTHDNYRRNCDQFTLPGARWIPDNKELAANFGVAEIEVELDLDQEAEKVNAYGPFKDPLSGREVVAPPRWFIEKEAVRQQQEIQSRATSRAATIRTLRESQGFGSQPTRMSQPFVERNRNNLNQFVSFVEGRMNKNRPSTHLNTGLVDMFVDNFGTQGHTTQFNKENDYDAMEVDVDFDGGGYDNDDDNADDYVNDLSRRRQKRAPAPWDDLEKMTRVIRYNGDEELPVSRKAVKAYARDPPTPMEMMKRKNRREEKVGKSRRDEFMETHDYLQDYYYWRSAARINPGKDWKVEALRAAILKEKKRRVKEKTARIREARGQVLAPKRRTTRAGIAMENFEAVLEDVDLVPQNNRRTLGAEYDDVADEDLAAEVELSMLGGHVDFDDEDDVQPRGELPPAPAPENLETGGPEPNYSLQPDTAPSNYQPLRFDDIDDAELNSVINLPGNLFIDKALPLLKKFAENRTDREQMAYEMAKAYEDVDVAVSTLQEQVDNWHARLEPILDEGETRKEYDVHLIGRSVLRKFAVEGETKRLIDLVVGRPWYEISRYFLSCLFMCNVKNVMIDQNCELSLEERINSMTISLLSRDMHHEVFQQGDALE